MGEVIDKIKGKAKQIGGKLTGNDTLRREGVVDEIQGNLKGVAEKTVNAAKNIANTVKPASKKRHIP